MLSLTVLSGSDGLMCAEFGPEYLLCTLTVLSARGRTSEEEGARDSRAVGEQEDAVALLLPISASERRGDTFEGRKDCYLALTVLFVIAWP